MENMNMNENMATQVQEELTQAEKDMLELQKRFDLTENDIAEIMDASDQADGAAAIELLLMTEGINLPIPDAHYKRWVSSYYLACDTDKTIRTRRVQIALDKTQQEWGKHLTDPAVFRELLSKLPDHKVCFRIGDKTTDHFDFTGTSFLVAPTGMTWTTDKLLRDLSISVLKRVKRYSFMNANGKVFSPTRIRVKDNQKLVIELFADTPKH